jgi:hypothetical protein
MTTPRDNEATYELRATRPDGSITPAGVFATHAAAMAEAWRLLARGDARRVETRRRHGDRLDLLSVIGEPRPPTTDGADDRLRGLMW